MRLIDADALVKEAGKLWEEMPDGEELSKELMKAINHAPTVDAVPVVPGQWTTARTLDHDGEWYCSVCGYEPTVFENTPYCPNCGAKMDKVAKE